MPTQIINNGTQILGNDGNITGGTQVIGGGTQIIGGTQVLPNNQISPAKTQIIGNSTTGSAVFAGGLLPKGTSISGWLITDKINVQSGEADLYIAEKAGEKGVIKYYRGHIHPKTDLLEKLANLHHPDIINVYEFGEYQGHFYEIMEYAAGGSLDTRNEDGSYKYLPLSEEKVIQACKEIINSYKTCHEKGIIHRDIKPANIYYKNADGSDIVIGDFGISSLYEENETISHKTQTASRTTGYAAPEVLSGIISPKMDYYALGITLWELSTGKDPFVLENGKRRNDAHLLRDTIEGRIADDLLSQEPVLSKSMQHLIRGLLVIDDKKRWGYDEVVRHLNGENVEVAQKEVAAWEYSVENTVCTTLEQVGTAILNNLESESLKKEIFRGFLVAFFEDKYPDIAKKMESIIEESSSDMNLCLKKIALLLNPSIPYITENGYKIENIDDVINLIQNAPEEMIKVFDEENKWFYIYFEHLGYKDKIPELLSITKGISNASGFGTMLKLGKVAVLLKDKTITPFVQEKYKNITLTDFEQLSTLPKELQDYIFAIIKDKSLEGLIVPWLYFFIPENTDFSTILNWNSFQLEYFPTEEQKLQKIEAERREKEEKERIRIESLRNLEQRILKNEKEFSLDDLLLVEQEFHNPQIQFYLCERFREKKDYRKAFEYISKSAEQHYPDGIARLAGMYIFGEGIEENSEKGIKLIGESINLKSPLGYNLYGYLYEKGKILGQDYNKAFEWYQKAAEKGLAVAQRNLGDMYYFGNGVPQDYNKAIDWYQKSADQGYAGAQSNLGNMYYYGIGIAQDYSKAANLYKKSAEQGNVWAQLILGTMYEDGKGVSQDYSKAVEWYQKAAEQGDAQAQRNLANMYYTGKGIVQNYENAIKWYQKSAEQGLALAQNNLGNMYYNGEGVSQDYSKAMEWYQKAAEQGLPSAQNNLGNMYYNGYGVSQDYGKAIEWYQKVAEQGYAEVQSKLGNMYCNGIGVMRDYDKAIEWYQKAAKQGDETAQSKIEECQSRKIDQCMIYVKGGRMTLGSKDENSNKEHNVLLSDFYISNIQVTQELYESVTGKNPSDFKGNRNPVGNVSWYEAVEFCNLLSEKEGLKPCYNIDRNTKDSNNKSSLDKLRWTVKCDFKANGYRLPTEAEWEYAARGGEKSNGYKYAGSNDIDEVAWHRFNSLGIPHAVGLKKPNELGLYDMSGNVDDWCWDWKKFDESDGNSTILKNLQNYFIDSTKNPTGASSGKYRIRRGGCVFGDIFNIKSVFYSTQLEPYNHSDDLGFRVCRSHSK